MKYARLFNALVLLAMLSVGFSAPLSPATQAENPGLFVPGEVVVGFASGKFTPKYVIQATDFARSVDGKVVAQEGNVALLSFAEDADVESLAAQLAGMPGVAYAEPNYIYRIPEQATTPNRPAPVTTVARRSEDETFNIPVDALKAMRTVKRNKITATYPNDPYLWNNWGWAWVGADIVSSNATVSKNVCVLDTGVDYTHPDLTTSVIKGLDLVNNDADPMDDNGHGTHVAGVISAIRNNAKGIAGVSTGKVVAVKVLNAQGWGTSYGIASGILYCANRADVSVMNLSLGGSYSVTVDYIVDYAVNTKGKLIVAAAGNNGSSTPDYPGGLSIYYPNKVLAVAALDYGGCRAGYSNYGSWVSVAAPGTDILSTLPYNKPFYLGYYYGYESGYDYLSGTSMATPFVAAAAARRWGYHPGDTNFQVGEAVRYSGYSLYADDSCWPASMAGKYEVNVAYLLDRGAAWGYTYNATTGLPLTGAKFQIYTGSYYAHPGTLRGTAIVPGTYSGYADVINLPVGSGNWGWTTSAQTVGAQWTFWHTGSHTINGGTFTYFGRGYVPNKDGNFTSVTSWLEEWFDIDMNAWLPNTPNVLDPGQPAPFIVGPEGYSFGFLEGEPIGTLLAFPYAIYNREGGYTDWMPMESITIKKRFAHSGLVTNAALPYYPGDYYIGVTDYGQYYPSTSDPLLYYVTPFNYVWKDGKIINAGITYGCYAHSWYPWNLYSGKTGSVSLYFVSYCTSSYPYAGEREFSVAKSPGATMKP